MVAVTAIRIVTPRSSMYVRKSVYQKVIEPGTASPEASRPTNSLSQSSAGVIVRKYSKMRGSPSASRCGVKVEIHADQSVKPTNRTPSRIVVPRRARSMSARWRSNRVTGSVRPPLVPPAVVSVIFSLSRVRDDGPFARFAPKGCGGGAFIEFAMRGAVDVAHHVGRQLRRRAVEHDAAFQHAHDPVAVAPRGIQRVQVA